jgi:hypothetical protein
MGSAQQCRGLSARECARWLIDTDEGRQWARQREGTMSMAQMVANLVNLSANAAAKLNARAASNKRKAQNMSSTETILKTARRLGEFEMTRIITDHAKRLYPTMTREAAFVKCFTEDSAEGRALRTIHAISKGEHIGTGMMADAPDEADDDDSDALEELNALAEAERRRSGTTKAIAFSKVYCDPANARLAQRERAQNRPRA